MHMHTEGISRQFTYAKCSFLSLSSLSLSTSRERAEHTVCWSKRIMFTMCGLRLRLAASSKCYSPAHRMPSPVVAAAVTAAVEYKWFDICYQHQISVLVQLMSGNVFGRQRCDNETGQDTPNESLRTSNTYANVHITFWNSLQLRYAA